MNHIVLSISDTSLFDRIKGLIPGRWNWSAFSQQNNEVSFSVIVSDQLFLQEQSEQQLEYFLALQNRICLIGTPEGLSPSKLKFIDDFILEEQLEKELESRLHFLSEKIENTSDPVYKSLFENSTVGIYRTSPEGKVLMANPVLLQMLGFESLEELQKIDINKNYAPNYERKRFIEKIKREGIIRGLEDAWTRNDGSIIYVRESARAIRDEEGNILYFDGVVEDITEKKIIENQLKESEEKFRSIFQVSPDAISISTLEDGRFIDVNESLCSITGYQRQELIGKSSLEINLFHYPEERNIIVKELIENQSVLNREVTFRKKNGELFTALVSLRIMNYGDQPHILTVARDITELKTLQRQKEQLFEESERIRAELEEVFGRITDGVVALDKDWNYTYVNDQAVRLVQRKSKEELLGKNIWKEFPEDIGGPFYKGCMKALETQQPVHVINYFEPWDKWFDNRIYPSANGVTVYFNDITEQKKTELELERSRQRLQFLLHNSPIVIYSYKLDNPFSFNFVSVNSQTVLGLDHKKLIGDKNTYLDSIHPDDLPYIKRICRNLKKEKHISVEYRFKKTDGQIIWLLDQYQLVSTDEGDEVIGYLIDITNRKQIEQNLAYSERLLHEAQKIARIGSMEFNLADGRSYWTDEIYKILGIEKTSTSPNFELFLNRIHPSDKARFDYVYRKSLDTQKTFTLEFRIITPDQRIKWVRFTGKTFSEKQFAGDRIVGTLMDITDRKLAELALKENEAKFRSVFEHTGTASIIVDQTGRIIHANAECEKATGYKVNELVGTYWQQYVAPESLPMMREYFQSRFDRKKSVPPRYETKLLHKDGTVRHCLISAGIIPFSRNLVVNMWDISERVQIEQENKLMATAIEHSAEAIFITDSENRIIYTNKRFEEIYGYQFEEVFMKKPGILRSKDQNNSVAKEVKNTIYAGEFWQGYLVNQKKNGENIEIFATISPIKDEQGKITHFISIHRDVTREKEIERRIQQSQRLEAIGTLAGGIAHDFNNILTPLIGYTEIVMKLSANDKKLYSRLEKIHSAALRARNLIQQILTFSRQRTSDRDYLKIEPLVRETVKLLRASIPKSITININIDKIPYTVYANPTEIHQILMNLCTNAYQAMGENGEITIGLKSIFVPLEEKDKYNVPDGGQYVELSVKDTGEGIPQEIIDKIFEPYFTTKGNKGGTGLGLAIVHGIVNSYGGGIKVVSEQGKGTTFFIFLPASQSKGNIPEQHSNVEEWDKGKGYIMVVDDEKDVLDMMMDLLKEAGFNVDVFDDPERALNTFRKDGHKYDLIITDTTMPGMTGDQLMKKIREIDPDIPLILCTGYNERVNEKIVEEFGKASFLMKPFNFKQLFKMIRDHLDNKNN